MSPNRLYREQVHSRHLVTAPQLPNSFVSSGVALLRPGILLRPRILPKPSNFRGLHAYKRLRVLSMFLVHPGAPDQATDVWLWKSDKNAETMFTRPLREFAELYEHNALAGRSLQAAFPPIRFWCRRVNLAGGQGVSEASPTSSDSSGYWSDEAVSDPSTRCPAQRA